MEYKTIDEIARVSEATPDVALTRTERLERWAAALERLGKAQVSTLWRTEYAAPELRASLRSENSPLSVAFGDPFLRVAGLKDDSYAEAKRFFELTDRQLHWVVCECHFGHSMSAIEAARRVRSLTLPRAPMAQWLVRAILGRHATA